MKKLFLILLIPFIFGFGYEETVIIAKRNAVGDGAIGITASNGQVNFYTSYCYHDEFQPTTPGNVRYGHAKVKNDGTSMTVCVGLYDASGNLLLSGSTTISFTGTQWVNIDTGSSYNVLNSTNYVIGFQSNTTASSGYGLENSSAGTAFYYDSISYNCSNNPINPKEATSGISADLTLYFDNSAGDPS